MNIGGERMIGQRLKKFRKERGLTQSQLGKGILSISYISQIENNNLPIPDYLIEELAKRLDISVNNLLGCEEDKKIEQLRKRMDQITKAIYHMQFEEVAESMQVLEAEVKEIVAEELIIEYAILEMMYALMCDKVELAEQKINSARDLHISKYPHLFYRFLRVIGIHKYLKGLYAESLEFYRKAFQMEEETKKVTLDSAYLVYNMALAYWQLSNYQRTYYYNQIAYSRFTELGNWYGLCESIMMFGVVYYSQNYYDKSLEQFEKALKLAEDISEKYLQSVILHNMGLVYERIQKYDEAYDHWNKSLHLLRELNDKKYIALTLHSIAEAYFNQEEYESFILHMNLLTDTLKECDYPHVEGKSLQLMGDYYRKHGDLPLFQSCYSKAITCLLRGNLLLDSAEITYGLATEMNDPQLFKQAAEFYHKYHAQLINS